MIDLNETPQAVHTLNNADVVLLDGRQFVFEDPDANHGGIVRVHLTAVDIESTGVEPTFSDYEYIHMRLAGDVAAMTRAEMVDALTNKTYWLG